MEAERVFRTSKFVPKSICEVANSRYEPFSEGYQKNPAVIKC